MEEETPLQASSRERSEHYVFREQIPVVSGQSFRV